MPAYVTLPGTSGNYFSTPIVNLLDADTANLEQSIGEWYRLNAGSSSIALEASAAAVFGDNVLKLTVTSGAGSGRGVTETSRPTSGGGIAVTPSTTYAFVVSAGSPTYDISVNVLEWNSTTFVKQTALGPIAAGAGLTTVSASFTVGSSTDSVNFQIGISDSDNPQSGDVVYVDAACVREGSTETFIPSLRIVGDLEIEAKVALDDYTPTATNTILDCLNSNDGYRLRHTTGDLIEIAYGNGSSTRAQTSSATGLSDGTAHTIKVTVDQSTGAVVYYIDGVQHDTDTMTTGAGQPDINDLVVGANAAASANWTDGDIYYVIVRDGIDGPVVARFDADDWVGA